MFSESTCSRVKMFFGDFIRRFYLEILFGNFIWKFYLKILFGNFFLIFFCENAKHSGATSESLKNYTW
jgi:hypothetical protein